MIGNKKIKGAMLLLVILFLAVMPGVIAEDYATQEAVKPITDVIDKIAIAISTIGGSVATLVLAGIGLKLYYAKSPEDREKAMQGIKNVLIGLAVIVLAPQIVRVLIAIIF